MMTRYVLSAMLLFLPCRDALAQGFNLEAFLWKQRPLILFAPASDSSCVRDFRTVLQHAKADFQDRDMVFIEAYESGNAWLDGSRLPAGTGRELRKRFGVADTEEAVILVGKDGGEKLRTTPVTDLDRIFGLIDTMPMRRLEMRRQAEER